MSTGFAFLQSHRPSSGVVGSCHYAIRLESGLIKFTNFSASLICDADDFFFFIFPLLLRNNHIMHTNRNLQQEGKARRRKKLFKWNNKLSSNQHKKENWNLKFPNAIFVRVDVHSLSLSFPSFFGLVNVSESSLHFAQSTHKKKRVFFFHASLSFQIALSLWNSKLHLRRFLYFFSFLLLKPEQQKQESKNLWEKKAFGLLKIYAERKCGERKGNSKVWWLFCVWKELFIIRSRVDNMRGSSKEQEQEPRGLNVQLHISRWFSTAHMLLDGLNER